MQRRTACLILLLLFSMGCRVGPRYDPPCPPVPQNWKNPTHENAFLSDVGCWWEVFDDGRLNALEIQAVMNNPTIHLALARIEEAWALAGIRRADLFPQLNIQPSFTNTGQLFELFLPQGTQVTIPSPIFRVHLLQYALPLNLSYEVDLWGKYRSQYESAYQNAQAEEEAYRATILSLTAELASTYFNLRAYDTLANILQRTLENRQSDYNLIKSRFEKGLVNYLDVSNASLEVSNTESDYDDALKQRGIQENMIATLVGTPASELRLEPMPLLEAPPFIPAGIPSTVLLRRPDIAQAERTMASDNSQIRAAYADFFPSLSLTGTLGFLSPDVRQFLRWISRYWALGF
jgi:outer membrane protein, multidrug efflux system